MLPVPSAHGAEAEKRAALPDVCEITGQIATLRHVVRSPWKNGAPSTLAIREINIAVVIDTRFPHVENIGVETCRTDAAKGKRITYKLCSPTRVKAGDIIRGTEGIAVVDSYGVGCLFDVAILPKT